MMIASRFGYASVVALLLDHEAEVDLQSIVSERATMDSFVVSVRNDSDYKCCRMETQR